MAYFSKTMVPAECNYAIHDKKLLAIIQTLKKWQLKLEGLQQEDPFDILTNHQALKYFMTTKVLISQQIK